MLSGKSDPFHAINKCQDSSLLNNKLLLFIATVQHAAVFHVYSTIIDGH